MYAQTEAGRVMAARGLRGTCPACGWPVRPKCGSIVVHHWAHHARGDCDPWSEPESEWHRGWKLAVPPERREVVMGRHRADIVTASGGVVEVQRSSISPEVISEREAFYGERMAWIFDTTMAHVAIFERKGRPDVYLRWPRPRWSAAACSRLVLLDLGGVIFRAGRLRLGGVSEGMLYTRSSPNSRAGSRPPMHGAWLPARYCCGGNCAAAASRPAWW